MTSDKWGVVKLSTNDEVRLRRGFLLAAWVPQSFLASLGQCQAFKKNRPRLRSDDACVRAERSRGHCSQRKTRCPSAVEGNHRAQLSAVHARILGRSPSAVEVRLTVFPNTHNFNRGTQKQSIFPFPRLKPWAVVSRLDLVNRGGSGRKSRFVYPLHFE